MVEKMLRTVSRNNTRSCYVLKCDIRRFFDSIDHNILLKMLEQKIKDPAVMWLLERIVSSYEREGEREEKLRGERDTRWQSHLPIVCEYLYEQVRSVCKA